MYLTAGRTALEYALQRRECADGLYKTADHMGMCVMSFIKSDNAFAGMLQVLVKATGAKGWYTPNLAISCTQWQELLQAVSIA